MLLLMVGVGIESDSSSRAWMMRSGDEETAFGLIVLPRSTHVLESG